MADNDIPSLYPGAVLTGKRRYTIEHVLGAGGFGITYSATTVITVDNISVTARVAVKEHFVGLYNERGADSIAVTTPGSQKVRELVANSLKDFLGEARRLQRLGDGHRNIVKVNEVFEANGTAYYVMEYLEGSTLWKAVEGRGMSEADMIGLIEPVVEAVAYLHANRLTHLDVKPQNIMLATEGAGVRPVLIDFGLSKHYDADGHATSTINTLACSDGYSPAEQYSGITTFTPSADVYALGATMIACLTGQTPPKSTEWTVGDRLRYVDSMIISGPLRAALRGALADGTERLPDAGALLAALPAAGARKPYVPPVDDKGTAVIDDTKPARRSYNRLIIAAAAALMVAVGAFFGIRLKPAPTPLPAPTDTTAIAAEETAANDAANDVGMHHGAPTDQERIEEPTPAPTPALAPAPTPAPTPEPVPVASQSQNAVDVWNSHRTPRNLYLAVRRGGNEYYFSEADWNSLSSSQRSECTRKGVVIDKDGERFILALNEESGFYTWHEAMSRFGNLLPTKEQAEAWISQQDAVRRAVRAFGGFMPSRDDRDYNYPSNNSKYYYWYWTRTEYSSSYAWYVIIYDDNMRYATKTTSSGRVRVVVPVSGSSAM